MPMPSDDKTPQRPRADMSSVLGAALIALCVLASLAALAGWSASRLSKSADVRLQPRNALTAPAAAPSNATTSQGAQSAGSP